MIKRLPQEIADFTGCWVAQTPTGHWFIAKKRPLLRSYGWFIRIENRYDLPDGFVNVPEGHSWDYLYEPQGKEGKTEEDSPYFTETADSDNKEAPYSGKQADSDNKHQSQVHVHQEYAMLSYYSSESLTKAVNGFLGDGWKLYGNPFAGEACLYQAIVRGLE